MKEFLLLLSVILVFAQCRNTTSHESVENMRWKLVEVNGQTISTPPGGREIFMTLVPEDGAGKLQGFAGCNSLGGSYKLENESITFEAITTRMYCALQMTQEKLFTDLLTSADRFHLRGNQLALYADEKLLGKFEAIASPEESCYRDVNGKDTVRISFTAQDSVRGTLEYLFYEKDKSRGEIKGVLRGDTLYAIYQFWSEGIASTREVVFLRDSDQLIPGYEEAVEQQNQEHRKSHFIFLPDQAMKRVPCNDDQPSIM